MRPADFRSGGTFPPLRYFEGLKREGLNQLTPSVGGSSSDVTVVQTGPQAYLGVASALLMSFDL